MAERAETKLQAGRKVSRKAEMRTVQEFLGERLFQDLLADPSLVAQSIGHLGAGDWKASGKKLLAG